MITNVFQRRIQLTHGTKEVISQEGESGSVSQDKHAEVRVSYNHPLRGRDPRLSCSSNTYLVTSSYINQTQHTFL